MSQWLAYLVKPPPPLTMRLISMVCTQVFERKKGTGGHASPYLFKLVNMQNGKLHLISLESLFACDPVWAFSFFFCSLEIKYMKLFIMWKMLNWLQSNEWLLVAVHKEAIFLTVYFVILRLLHPILLKVFLTFTKTYLVLVVLGSSCHHISLVIGSALLIFEQALLKEIKTSRSAYVTCVILTIDK